jgi:hypothetical protein
MGAYKYPVFKSHQTARCYHCNRPLDLSTTRDAGYPAGAGRYAATCSTFAQAVDWQRCDRVTFYDLKAEV